jgi:hypothetical protein
MKFSFDVGRAEVHRVDFQFSQMIGTLTISVDGEPVARDLRTFSVSLVKVYEFRVGREEQHVVRIEKERRLFLASLRPQQYRAFIDGELVKECRGY